LTAPAAFLEDCARAAIVITPLHAPQGCAAPLVIDRDTLARTGAVTLRLMKDGGVEWSTARAIDQDRPWSPRPRETGGRASPEDEDNAVSEPLE
jgi:competence protein ComEC